MNFIALIGNNIGKIVLTFVVIVVALLYVPDEPISDLLKSTREWLMDRAFSGIIFLFYMLVAFLVFICIVNPFVSAADIDSNRVILFLLTFFVLRTIKRH